MNNPHSDPGVTCLPGLRGRRVVVTAGASGIGFAIARFLHTQGAQLAICDVDTAALKTASTSLGNCLALPADVSDDAAVDTFFDAVQDQMDGLDALVNNAGIAGPTGKIEDLTPSDWRRCIDICLTGQFLCARRAVPMIKAAGGGALINMGSAASKHGYAFRTPYSAAKFGVIGLTQSLAKDPSGQIISGSTPSCQASSRGHVWKVLSRPVPRRPVLTTERWRQNICATSLYAEWCRPTMSPALPQS